MILLQGYRDVDMPRVACEGYELARKLLECEVRIVGYRHQGRWVAELELCQWTWC